MIRGKSHKSQQNHAAYLGNTAICKRRYACPCQNLCDLLRHNEMAPIIHTRYGRIDKDLVFGMTHKQLRQPPRHRHQLQFTSFSYTSNAYLGRYCFEQVVESLPTAIIRAKGFVRCTDGTYLFNAVAGRWELEPFAAEDTELVFIGKGLDAHRASITQALQRCEVESDHTV